MRQSAITCKAPAAVRRTRQREVRDPYDELRPWSAITHGAGDVLSAVGTALLLRLAILRGSGLLVTVFLIYGLSMTGLYTASTLYHCVNTSVAGRRALRKYDHCSIYLLIAGSYTPVCMLTLWEGIGKVLLALVWGIAAAGMILKLFWVYCPKWVSSVLYIGMGWVCILAFPQLWNNLSAAQFGWLLAGGIIYTIGGVIYALKLSIFNDRHPCFGSHEIFHLFVMGGSLCHFIVMFLLV